MNKSYGTASVQDGVRNISNDEPNKERSGLVRYSSDYVPEIVPKIYNKNQDLNSFEVNIFYRDYKYIYDSTSLTTNYQIQYSKNFTRIASARNVVSDLKNFVAEYAGCYEAHKLRKRIIALSKLRGSVSGETFRFGVEE